MCLVCLGNICRSPMAEVVPGDELERAGLSRVVEVGSAGTRPNRSTHPRPAVG